MNSPWPSTAIEQAEQLRVRGVVQGVGFRPAVWRLARRHGLRGWVANDALGVHMHVCGLAHALESFIEALRQEAPPLARIDSIERQPAALLEPQLDFRIVPSRPGEVHTEVAPDAATCPECRQEILDPFARRYRYAFTNCTHCGPRLSILRAVPYDRASTTMAAFALCADCAEEYADPADRRFHAQPIACHACGPQLRLERTDGHALALDALTSLDAADAACTLLKRGEVVCVQGLGGYQLACDATQPQAVARLRAGKRRESRPFALMARDLAVIREYAEVDAQEAALLSSAAAPIVVLRRLASAPAESAAPARAAAPAAASPLAAPAAPAASAPALAEGVAPRLDTLGFMLPNTPLHHLMLRRMERPIVLTSGNLSDEPQAIEAQDARERLGAMAAYLLEHNRPIARRVDDSLARVMARQPRLLRRARGYAPAALPLPEGFAQAPAVLALGGELKNTFCVLKDGAAVLAPHVGDLHEARTRQDWLRALGDFTAFLDFTPQALACDLHPGYGSSLEAQQRAARDGVPMVATQHHHAHLAACLAENGVALHAPPVLGVVLDGLGLGDDGTLWGGEFLLANYAGYRRLGHFRPVALPGGEAAIHEPWRNTYAHLMAQMGWPAFAMNYEPLELYRFLERQPRALLDGMLRQRVNAPLASSCGRLFDAVAAAVGLARERAHYEGQGACELEAAIDAHALAHEDPALDYPFAIPLMQGRPYIEPLAMWSALLGDLILHTPVGVMAARFHRGLAATILRMVERLARQVGGEDTPLRRVALSGGVFQNRVLFERVLAGLQAGGYTVYTHAQVPCNDGGLALGQAAIAAARMLQAAPPPA